MCVKKSTFDSTMYGSGNNQSRQAIDAVLHKNANRVYMVTSESDTSTAAEVDILDIDSWIDGIMEETKEGAVRSKKCTHCMDLTSNPLAPGTDSLKMEASLMTVGVAAATAVLWVAILSG